MTTAVQPVEEFTFDPIRHCYTLANGTVVPSCTQVIKKAGLINFDMVDPEVLARKALLGKLVHQACHYFDENDLPESLPEEVEERLEAYKLFRAETGYRPDANEVRIIAQVYGIKYGMQFDSTGLLNGLPTIIDLKTGVKTEPAWGVQTAGYALGIGPPPFQRYRHKEWQRVVVQLLPGPRYKLTTYKDPGDQHIFIAALALTTWKNNHDMQ